ncbi:hypothetical protein [Simplicispira piscis]
MHLPDFLGGIGRQRTSCLREAVKKHSDLEVGADSNFLLGLRAHTPASAFSKNKPSKNIAATAIPISARGQKHYKSGRKLNP